MRVRHLWNDRNEPITEALYEHIGQNACSRFLGHLSAEQVQQILDRYRLLAAQVPMAY